MKIILADDHDLVRDSLTNYVKSEWPEATVIGVEDAATLLEELDNGPDPDLVISDYVMPGMDGLKGVKMLLDRVGNTPLVMISGLAPIDDVIGALRLGAAGFLFKTMSPLALVSSLRLVMAGEVFVPKAVLDMVPMNNHRSGLVREEIETLPEAEGLIFEKLTERERQTLLLLTDGMTNKDIANELNLQEITVKVHLKHVYRKLGVSNRTQASNMAFKLGFVSPK